MTRSAFVLGLIVSCAVAGSAPAQDHSAQEGARDGDDASPLLLHQLSQVADIGRSLGTTWDAARLGFRRIAPPSMNDLNPLVGEHWIHIPNLRSGAFDLTRPAYAMYYPVRGIEEWQLVGVAYATAAPTGTPVPEGFDGANDHWHTHLPCSGVPELETILAASQEDCREFAGVPGSSRIAMVHVWLNVPNPEGPFADFNIALPYVATGLQPPTPEELRDTTHAGVARPLALALGETLGAVPRLGGIVDPGPDSAFARRVAAPRARIAALVPRLKAAQETGDRVEFDLVALRAIEEWNVIRQAYLDAASTPVLRLLLARWMDEAVNGTKD